MKNTLAFNGLSQLRWALLRHLQVMWQHRIVTFPSYLAPVSSCIFLNRLCLGSNLKPSWWDSDTLPMCYICLVCLWNLIYLKLNIFLALILYLSDDVSSNVFTSLVCILLPFFTEKIDSFQLEYLLWNTSDFCKPSTFAQDSDIKYGCYHRLFPDTSNNHY